MITDSETNRTASKTIGRTLGAVPHEKGVSFGVWAPHAESVSVVGSFNDWDGDRNLLLREENGCWFADVPNAKIGDEYRYRISYRGKVFEKIDPRARQVTHSAGNAVVHNPQFDWEDDRFTPAPLNELILYELHIGTFSSLNRACGTLDTAIDKLPHLTSLGVNGIQLMPVVEFPGDRSWGYEPSHPFAVESAYGGPQALRRFIKAAHRYGIAVFVDVIYNHFGPGDLHLWRFDGWYEGERGGIYFYQDERAKTPWGDRPDYSRREVREYIFDNALMWIEEYRADGLRVDGSYFTRTAANDEADADLPRLEDGWSLLCGLTEAVRRVSPHAVVIAEDMRGDESLTRPVVVGGAGFDTQWTDQFAHGLRKRASVPQQQQEALRNAANCLSHAFNDDPFQRVIYVESHDNAGKDEQVVLAADPDDPEGLTARRWLALATTCTFTAPGVPLLFQGQEIITFGGFTLENCKPLDWSRVERFSGNLRFHQDLIAIRRNKHGSTGGLTGRWINLLHRDEASGILIWHRWHTGGPGDDVIVAINFSNEPRERIEVEVPAAGMWRVRLDSGSEQYELHGTTCPDLSATVDPLHDERHQIEVALNPFGVVVLSQDRPARIR